MLRKHSDRHRYRDVRRTGEWQLREKISKSLIKLRPRADFPIGIDQNEVAAAVHASPSFELAKRPGGRSPPAQCTFSAKVGGSGQGYRQAKTSSAPVKPPNSRSRSCFSLESAADSLSTTALATTATLYDLSLPSPDLAQFPRSATACQTLSFLVIENYL